MPQIYKITTKTLSIEDILPVWRDTVELRLDESAIIAINKCRDYLESRLAASSESIYGVNTGFGSLCNVSISPAELDTLQQQLIVSHAAGTGDILSKALSKQILFLKILALSRGYSGVRLELVEKMIDLYNKDIIPVIYSIGSLGASGDLAPLAHMSLPLIGEGAVHYGGDILPSSQVLKSCNMEPLTLKAKEGIALLNGTQFSLAHGLEALLSAKHLIQAATSISAASCEGFNVQIAPYHHLIQDVRRQPGQQAIAAEMYAILSTSPIIQGEKQSVQDPYSFRCIPQVHGASKQVIDHVTDIFTNELNAVTDNPTIFPDEDLILSGGNFHAQPLALALEYLGIGLSELANISERRIYNLINGDRDLPHFLTAHAGLSSGYMIAQYTAAAIVNQTKHLANPVATDSITSSRGQEDHVSMAANAGTKTVKIAHNLARVLGIELLLAAQALHFRQPAEPSQATAELLSAFRARVPVLEMDRVLAPDMHAAEAFVWEKFGW